MECNQILRSPFGGWHNGCPRHKLARNSFSWLSHKFSIYVQIYPKKFKYARKTNKLKIQTFKKSWVRATGFSFLWYWRHFASHPRTEEAWTGEMSSWSTVAQTQLFCFKMAWINGNLKRQACLKLIFPLFSPYTVTPTGSSVLLHHTHIHRTKFALSHVP